MRRCLTTIIINAAVALSLMSVAVGADVLPNRGLYEVGHERVELRGGFWGRRLDTHCEVTAPHTLDSLEKDGHVTNFDKAAGKFDGPLRGHHAFDSDLHKALEGALYCLQHRDDSGLRKRAEGIVDRILAAQQEDGFLISYYIVKDSDKRWEDLRLEHQMYNAGHFFEMAVEHNRLTGDPRALNAAKRFADHIDGIFGPGKRYDVGGHEEIELALVKLYRATGERRYLELSRFLLDERGHLHGTERKSFESGPLVAPERVEGQSDAEYRRAKWHASLRWRNGRMQDHKPLVEQTEAVGHAVRAGYIYSAMADIARFMDAPEYERAVDNLWQDVVSRKMYVNGSIGTAQYGDEGFGDPYLLPNRTYCESCASIAHVFWQHRMNLLKGQAKYADVMELALYNSAISGISITGNAFFYQNPLESKGSRRSPWIGLACCPTNLTRIIPQVGGLAYARSKNRLYVNLFVSSDASVKMDDGVKVKLTQETNYPWDGHVKLTVRPEQVSDFELCMRIPGWALGRVVPSDLYRFADSKVARIGLKVNGKTLDAAPAEDGYIHLKRSWKAADVVELDMSMPVRRVYAHEKVEADRGKVALMRGPITYCIEAVDNPNVDIFGVTLPLDAELRAEYRDQLLGGVTVLQGECLDDRQGPVTLTAVPYYSWANREKGAMTIWINEPPVKRESVAYKGTAADGSPHTELALTPPMGWNSWNAFEKDIDEDKIKEIADAMVGSGMRDAGYTYLVLDDAWMASDRDGDGRLAADLKKFPSGMKAIGDYIHSKGLKFGIYEDRGHLTCQQLPGSFGHERIDMETFAQWGVDYIKMDSCFAENNGRMSSEDYALYRKHIQATGRPIVLSISDFGNAAWAWGGKESAQLWRTSGDIYPWMDSVYHCADTSGGDRSIHPAFNGLWQFAGPGHWNDPDMLQVGNLKDINEDRREIADRAHFSLWCILAAPLMAGNDLRTMSDKVRNVLTAPELIAVNQDRRGVQGYKVFNETGCEVYNKPLSDGTTAVLLLNKGREKASITVHWDKIGLSGKQPVRDLWAREDLGEFEDSFTARDLGRHEHKMIKVGRTGPPLPTPATMPLEKYTVTGKGATYLSDLYYIWKAGNAPIYNATYGGDPISLAGQTFKKGLGCKSKCAVMFKVDGRGDRFQAIAAVDKSSNENAEGRFRVYNEDFFANKVLWDSGKMTENSPAKEIDIELKDVQCLMLVFDGKDVLGNWADARVISEGD